MRKFITAFFVMVLISTAASCGLASSKINELCLVYTGGVTQDAEYEKLLPPGSNANSIGLGSTTYCYPIDQRTYIAGDGGDTDPVEAVSKDTVRVGVEYQLYFTINQTEEVIQEFHENLGVKTEAWTTEGWTELLRQYFEPQIERSIEAAALNYNWRDLFSSEEIRREFQQTVVANVKSNLNEVIGGDYFCGPDYGGDEGDKCGDFEFTVGKPYPVNADIVKAVEDEQKAVTQTNSQTQENLRIEAEARGKQTLVNLYGQDNAALIELCEKNPEACKNVIVNSGSPIAINGG